MKSELVDNGRVMEIGVMVLSAMVVGAVIALVAGRAMTRSSRTQGQDQGSPPRGSTPVERHHNVATVAAR